MATSKRPLSKQLAKKSPSGYRGAVPRGTKQSGPPSAFGRRLRALRNERGLTQQQLADLSGIKQVTISSLEVSPRTNPQTETIEALAAGLGVDPAQLQPPKVGPALAAFFASPDLCPADITDDERDRLIMVQPAMGHRASPRTYALMLDVIRGTLR
jgi:transcriptional regulator with XRE-family HTH domain